MGHARVYPMNSKADAYDKLDLYCLSTGIPNVLITDNAGEEASGMWNSVQKKFLIQQRTTEPYSPWQNKAEREIQELKKHFRRVMHCNRCPELLWDYGMEYTSKLCDHLSQQSLDGRTPLESTTGETPDISELLDFEFYGVFKYHGRNSGGTENDLGRWLGVAENVEQAMCYYHVLQPNGRVLVHSTVRPLLKEEWLDKSEKALRLEFDT